MPAITNKTHRWKRSKKAVYNISYHLIWCTKYRTRVLTLEVQQRLKDLLIQKSIEHEWEIKSLETMEDHVHAFISVHPTDSPHYVVGQLKGFSSHKLRKEFDYLNRRLPTLWTRSYYCESVGHISEASVKKYIETQKGV